MGGEPEVVEVTSKLIRVKQQYWHSRCAIFRTVHLSPPLALRTRLDAFFKTHWSL